MWPTNVATLPASTQNGSSLRPGAIGTIRCIGVDPNVMASSANSSGTPNGRPAHQTDWGDYPPTDASGLSGLPPGSPSRADKSYEGRDTHPCGSFSGGEDTQVPSLRPLGSSPGSTGYRHAGDKSNAGAIRQWEGTTNGTASQGQHTASAQASSKKDEEYVTMRKRDLENLLSEFSNSSSGPTVSTSALPPDDSSASGVAKAASNASKRALVGTTASVLLNMGSALATQMVVKNAMDAAGKHVVGPAATLLWEGGRKAWDAGVVSTAGKVFSGWWGS